MSNTQYGLIELPEGYIKDLKKLVRDQKANVAIYNLLNDIYKAGYAQASIDASKRVFEVIHAQQNTDPVNNDGREQL